MIEKCSVTVGLNCSIPASKLLRPHADKSSMQKCINGFSGRDPDFGGLNVRRMDNGTEVHTPLLDLRAYGVKDGNNLPTRKESDEIAKICLNLHEKGKTQKVSSDMFKDDINGRFFELLFCISCTNPPTPEDLCIATAEAKKLEACTESKTLNNLTWVVKGNSPTSSKKIVPPSATSKYPARVWVAPVNAPFS